MLKTFVPSVNLPEWYSIAKRSIYFNKLFSLSPVLTIASVIYFCVAPEMPNLMEENCEKVFLGTNGQINSDRQDLSPAFIC